MALRRFFLKVLQNRHTRRNQIFGCSVHGCHKPACKSANCEYDRFEPGGLDQNRTGVSGFAIRWITTLPRGHRGGRFMSGRRLIDDTAPGYNACFQAMLAVFMWYSGVSDNKRAWRDRLSSVFNRHGDCVQIRNGRSCDGIRRLRIRS